MEVLMAGGIPPGIDQPCAAEGTYRACFRTVKRQNDKFCKRAALLCPA
jgi:hypothetical protein